MKIKPEYVVIEHLKKFFTNTAADSISYDEIYEAWGRDLAEVERNIHWLSNKLIDLRRYGFIKSIHSKRNGKRIVTGIKLTPKGKTVLGRESVSIEIPESTETNEPIAQSLFPIPQPDNRRKITTQEIQTLIIEFEKQDPGLEVIFDVRLKKLS